MLPGFKAEARDLYPDSKGKRQGYVNSCYTKLVNKDKEYWESKAKAINELTKTNITEEDENPKPSRTQYVKILCYSNIVSNTLQAARFHRLYDGNVYEVMGERC